MKLRILSVVFVMSLLSFLAFMVIDPPIKKNALTFVAEQPIEKGGQWEKREDSLGYLAEDQFIRVIIINKKSWTVNYTTKDILLKRGCLAYSDRKFKQIWLPIDASLVERREDILHELMHISLAEGGGETDYFKKVSSQEAVINPAAPELVKILRENTSLEKWLFR